MNADLESLPDNDWRRLAQMIYCVLNFSMMYVSMNMIIAIICDTNVDVRREEFHLDWLNLAANYLKRRIVKMKRRTQYIFNYDSVRVNPNRRNAIWE